MEPRWSASTARSLAPRCTSSATSTEARWDWVESPSRFRFLIEHDLFGKPLHTFPDHALFPRNRIDRGEAKRKCAGAGVKPFVREDVLPRGVNVAQAPLQGRRVENDTGSAERIAAADDVGAGRVDPGAGLQALRKIRL